MFISFFSINMTDHPPDPYLPEPGESPRVPFREWIAMWKIYILSKSEAKAEIRANREMTMPKDVAAADRIRLLSSLDYTEKKKLLNLFTGLGTERYHRFYVRTGWEADNLEGKTHDEAVEICRGLFEETIRPIVARFNLLRRVQKKNESFEDFLCALRSIAKDCKFGALTATEAEEQRVVEAAIVLMKDDEPRKEILKEDAVPKLEKLRQIVTTYETQKKSADLLKNEMRAQSAAAAIETFSDSESTFSDISEIGDNSGVFVIQGKKYALKPIGDVGVKSKNNNQSSEKCFRCGFAGHKANYDKCPAKGKKCDKCGKIGHFSKVCKGSNVQKNARTGSITTVGATNDDDNRLLVDIWVDPSASSSPGKLVKFWGDSAAQVAMISESDFKKFFGKVKLLTSDRELSAMNGSRSKPLGMFRVDVEFKGRKATFMLYVVKNPSLTLLGLREMGMLHMTIDTAMRQISAVRESGTKCKVPKSASGGSEPTRFSASNSELAGSGAECKVSNFARGGDSKPTTLSGGDSKPTRTVLHDSPNNSDSDVLTAPDIPVEIVSEISNAVTNSKSEMLLNFLKKGFPEV
ncbi:MAG: hypothetical protein GY795_34925, partial [Desulfobacterales bacterium]|nr:hypothetical protein [Desulfobacterales bacterium]